MTTATHRSPAALWTHWPRLSRWPASAFAAGAVVLAMLIAFHQLVQASVQQAEQRRADAASLGDATWRCKALPPRDVPNCLEGIRPIVRP